MSVVAKVMDQIDLVKMICSHVSLAYFGALKLVNQSCYQACKQILDDYVDKPEALLKCLFQRLCTKTEGKLVLDNHIFSCVLPEEYASYKYTFARTLIGRFGRYFSKNGGGLIIYDDVNHSYPIKLPLNKIKPSELQIKYIGPSVRKLTFDTSAITKSMPLGESIQILRNQHNLSIPDEIQYGSTYKTVYLSVTKERIARRSDELTLAATDFINSMNYGGLVDNRKHSKKWIDKPDRIVGMQLLDASEKRSVF